MMNPISFFVEVNLFKKKLYYNRRSNKFSSKVRVLILHLSRVHDNLQFGIVISRSLRCRYLCISAECKIKIFLYCSFYGQTNLY